MLTNPITKQIHDIPSVVDVIRDAFQVSPWNISHMPESEIVQRLNMFLLGQRFILATWVVGGYHVWTAPVHDIVAGITWFGVPRADAIPETVIRHVNERAPSPMLVYYGATAVRKEWQNKGIARTLKTRAMSEIARIYPGCTIVTRMRSDNLAIIRVNESHGFVPTEITEHKYDNGAVDQWWFRTAA